MATSFQMFVGLLIYHTFSKLTVVQCYICSTPEEWLDKVEHGGYYLPTGIGGKWPGGVVKYQLNSTLTEKDKQEVFLAFDEFHKKTCIRFEPYSTGDYNYVSIEVDNSVCGMAHVCMQGGYQIAKFGQNCRNKNNMIHQLGHTICLSHEAHRHEGDKFITADKSCSSSNPQWRNALFGRIYDHASQMHFGCDPENKCGYQITSGLSVPDADYINALYNCQGCYRHRWIPKPTLSSIDTSTIYSFGFNDLGGGAIAPCRAFFKGEVSIGKYNSQEGTCYIGFEDKEYKLCDQYEVLTIPGGVRANDTEYLLVEAYQGMSIKKENAVFKNAVLAGRLPWADGSSSYGHGYIALGAVPNFQKSCQYNVTWWNGGANRKLDVIGRAWRYKNGTRAFAALCTLEFPLRIYYVLSCKYRESGEDTEDFAEEDDSSAYPKYDRELGNNNVGVITAAAQNGSDDITAESRHQQPEEQSNYFMPGVITGFLVFGVILALVTGILVYGRSSKGFGFGGHFSAFYNRDSSYEE